MSRKENDKKSFKRITEFQDGQYISQFRYGENLVTKRYKYDRIIAIGKLVELLGKYEDTGLTPEEIEKLKGE